MVEPRRAARHHTEARGSTEQAAGTASPPTAEQLIVTLNAATQQVVSVERFDTAGHRQELSPEDCAALAGEDEMEDFIAAAEDAYQAGLAEGLGSEEEQDEVDEDIVLWRVLVGRSITGGVIEPDLRHALLRRLLLRRLLRRCLSQTPVAPPQRSVPITRAAHNGSTSSS
jgi:hypothetical protein